MTLHASIAARDDHAPATRASDIPVKRCGTCRELKPAHAFFHARTPDGLTANCRTCVAENARRDREAREARKEAADAKRTKVCLCCKQSKPLTAFARYATAKDGRRRTCGPCVAGGKGTMARTRGETALQRDKARRKSAAGRKVAIKCANAWKEKHPDAVRAQKALAKAIRAGVVMRPARCQILGCMKSERLHGHHHDHAFPLDVLFCCGSHHKQIHAGVSLEVAPGLRPELVRIPDKAPRPSRVAFASDRREPNNPSQSAA